MHLIVGLGNPGAQYEKTRHNVGFMALDAIASDFQFPIFKFQARLKSQVAEGVIADQKVVLAKPQTMMNDSGSAARALLKNNKQITGNNLIVAHDDIDLPLRTVRVSRRSGSAGHKGVQSVIDALGTKEFTRVRIGIQPAEGKPADVEKFVLQKFSKKELPLLQEALGKAAAALESVLRHGPRT